MGGVYRGRQRGEFIGGHFKQYKINNMSNHREGPECSEYPLSVVKCLIGFEICCSYSLKRKKNFLLLHIFVYNTKFNLKKKIIIIMFPQNHFQRII